MPDFSKYLENSSSNEEEQNQPKQPKTIDEQFNEAFSDNPEETETDPEKRSYDLSGTSFANDNDAKEKVQDANLAETRFSGMDDINQDYSPTEGSWSPGEVNKGFVKTLQKSVMFGVGQMIGDYGDIAQVVGGDIHNGNMLSSYLQEWGQSIQDKNEIFIPEEVMNPKFKIETFANPKFWAVHGGRFIPQLLEIIGTSGVGSLAKKGVQYGAKKILKETLDQGANAMIKRGAKATTIGVTKGASKVNELNRTGKLGMFVRDTGELTQTFGNLIKNVTAGSLTNLRVGLASSGEVYNTYSALEDENGEKLFNKEELAQMAASTFSNNLNYIGVDILSWGMTYGKGFDKMKNMGINTVKKTFGKDVQKKMTGGLFTNSVSPLFQNIGKLGVKMGKEGVEEMVQETYEEWSKIQAYRDVNGSLNGYQGNNLSKEYEDSLGGFMDYFQSKENEATRTISFALGAMGAGAFNIRQLVDKSATESYKANHRSEALKTIFESGSEEKQLQAYHMQEQMNEIVYENKGEVFADWIKTKFDEGIINQKELEIYSSTFDALQVQFKKVKDLNIKGKKALAFNIGRKHHLNLSIREEQQRAAESIAFAKEQGADQSAIDLIEKNTEEKLLILAKQEEVYTDNIKNLISNKPIKKSNVKEDGPGQDAEIDLKIDDSKVTFSSLSDKAKSFYQSAKNGIGNILSKGKNDNVNAESNNNIQSQSEGSISDLRDVVDINELHDLEIGEELEINGEKSIVTARNENVVDSDGNITLDSFDYNTVQKSQDGKTDVVTAEGINARLTKNNTVHNDNTRKVLNIKRKNKSVENKSTINNELNPKVKAIIDNDNQIEITPAVLDDFHNNQNIPSGVLNSIANKIADYKIEPVYSPAELEVKSQFKEEIESLLTKRMKLEEQEISDLKNEFNDKESEFIKDAIESKRSDKTFKIEKDEYLKGLSKQKKKISNKDKSILSSVFGEEIVEAFNKKFGSNGRRSIDAKTTTDYLKETTKFLIKKAKYLRNLSFKLFSKGKEMTRGFSQNIDYGQDYRKGSIAESMIINERLEMMFPDVKPRSYVIQNLAETIGKPAIGYSLESAIFIDESKWNQESVFMHELSHIYLDITKDTPHTKTLIRNALKNEKLVNHILDLYETDIYYIDKHNNYIKKGDHIPKDLWNEKTKEERDFLMKDAGYRIIPIENQPVIIDEIFVAELEGPLSIKYTKLFNSKNDFKRKFFVKKWWSKLKERALIAKSDMKYNQKAFLRTLSKDEQVEYTNAKDYIIDKFRESIDGRPITRSGRLSTEKVLQKDLENKIIDAEERISTNAKESLGNKDFKKNENLDVNEEQEESAMKYDPDKTMDKDRLRYISKASKLIKSFGKAYNVILIKRFIKRSKDGEIVNWHKAPNFDTDLLDTKLRSMARKSLSSTSFLLSLENSDIEELVMFNKYLNKTRPDKEAFIQSYWQVMKNVHNMNTIQTFIDKDGNSKVQTNLSQKEKVHFENIYDGIYNSISASNRNVETKGSKRFEQYKKSAKAIRDGNYTSLDIYDVLDFFSQGKVNVKEIMENGYINIDGKNHPLESLIFNFLTSPNGMGASKRRETDGFKRFYKREDSITHGFSNEHYTSGVRMFIQSLLTTNRPYNADYITLDSKGNQTPTTEINNELISRIDDIKDNAIRLTKREFFNRYAHHTRSNKIGSNSNRLLDFFYESVNSGAGISLNKFSGGIKNSKTGKNKVLEELSSTENSINELITFMATSRKKGGTRQKSYLMDLGRFADSPRSFVTNVPLIPLSNLGKMVNGKILFNKKQKAFMESALAIQNKMGANINMKEYLSLIENKINKEIDFINNQNLSEVVSIKPLLNNKEKVSNEGSSVIAEYVLNQHLNGVYFSEIFLPSYSIADLTKRSKGIISPYFSMSPMVQIEAIPIPDPEIKGRKKYDGAIFIMTEDVKRIKELHGNSMPIGNGIKARNSGVEYDNDNFKSKNTDHKGFLFPIDEEYVKNNPELKGVLKLLKSRRKQYIDVTGVFNESLSSSAPTQLSYAYFTSADKSNNLPKDLIKKDDDGNDQLTELGEKFSLDGLNSSKDMNTVNDFLNDLYYDKDENGNLDAFLGLSGDNFGVQQVMDKITYESNVSSQFMKSVVTNSLINGTVEQAEEIQQLMVDMMQENMRELSSVLENGTTSDIRELLLEAMNLEEMDPIQAMMIKNDILSFQTPALRGIASNQLSNAIRLLGNKLRGPGTYAQQKPATYTKKYGRSNGSNQLAGFTKNTIGGKTTLNPGEIIAPSYMDKTKSKKGKIRKRQNITLESIKNNDTGIRNFQKDNATINQLSKMERTDRLSYLNQIAKVEARKYNTTVGELRNDKGEIIGYYVKGDTVLATRIPSHGPQSTGVFEVIDFDTTDSSQIQLPSDFSLDITGGDFDGDQVFIQNRSNSYKDSKWNRFIDMTENLWLNTNMQKEIVKKIEHEKEALEAIKIISKSYKIDNNENKLLFSPEDRRDSFNDTLIAKGSIGKVANIHALLGMFAAYEIEINKKITINGQSENKFNDEVDGSSRTINSANIFQYILDNSKDQFANKLGLNEHTVNHSMILRNLGFSLTDIGLLLNSPVYRKFVELKSEKNNVFTSEKEQSTNIISDLRKTKDFQINPNWKNNGDINLSLNKIKDFKNPFNLNQVVNLISFLENVNSDASSISTLMSGHNKLENNPFLLEDNIENAKDVLSNKNNKGITVNDNFKNNPLVKNYVKVAELTLKHQGKMNPVYRKFGVDVYNHIKNAIPKGMTNANKVKLYNAIELFFDSKLLNHNEINKKHYESLLDPKSDNNIFKRMQEYVNSAKWDIIKTDKNNPKKSISSYESSMLLTKGLSMNFVGNKKFISISASFFKNNISDPQRKLMINEFNQMPETLKNDLMLYDLMINGWKGSKSLFSLFDLKRKKAVSKRAELDVQNKDSKNYNVIDKEALINEIIKEHPEFIQSVVIKGKKLPFNVENKILKGEPVYFKSKGKIYYSKGLDAANIKNLDNEQILDLASKNSVVINPNRNNNIGIITLSGNEVNNNLPKGTIDFSEIESDIRSNPNSQGRESKNIVEEKKNYYKFTKKLSQEEYYEVKGFQEFVDDKKRKELYQEYKKEKENADKIKLPNLDNISDSELSKLFKQYMEKDKFAYAKILSPIILEVAKRNANEQSTLTKKYYNNKDISFIDSYLMSSNIPSNHPMVQALVRKMEVEHKKMENERSKIVQEINNVTENLYKDKFGSKSRFKMFVNNLFKNKKELYENLYGNLVEITIEKQDSEDVKNFKYKSKENIDSMFKNGELSQAEFDFYNVTQKHMKAFSKHVLEGKKGREDGYIPHTAPTMLEAFSRRGLLGMMINSKNINHQIMDVKLNFIDPLTGKERIGVMYKTIVDSYNAYNQTNSSAKSALELYKLKTKAISLLNTGLNQDGTKIKISNVEASSVYGDVFMDRFSKSRSVKSADIPSMDLNKAFVDYINTNLFIHGNDNVKGMKEMLPLVDGILAFLDVKGNINMKKYVDKVWKQYFLKGSKQKTIGDLSVLESIGVSSDSVIDYITKGSLLYWLGLKGLVIGKGVYAIGNVLIGKYNNIKNSGGKSWSKGEARFWKGKTGEFDITDPTKGIRESNAILKKIGFMDINIFDDVTIQKKNSFEKTLFNTALMPMVASERWIQGVQFLGLLTDKEWEVLSSGGNLSPERLVILENEVKKSQGKGYQATDQRMIQMYSWGRAMMQFSRYLPTMFHDKFAKEDIDRFGNYHIGSYRAMWKPIQSMAIGEMKPKEFIKFRNDLSEEERKRLDSGLIGFGMMAGLVAINTFLPNKTGEKMFWDANALFDTEKLGRKLTPASVNFVKQIL